MNDTDHLPASVRQYLAEVTERLAPLPAEYRAEVLDGVSTHIAEALDRGEEPAAILASLGPPEEVAAEALEQPGDVPPEDMRLEGVQPARYLNGKRMLQLIAFALAAAIAAASDFIVTQLSSRFGPDGHSVNSYTLLDGAGALLIIPLVLTAAPLCVVGRAWQPISIAATVLLVVFTFATLLTVGFAFLPATVMAAIALFLPVRPRR